VCDRPLPGSRAESGDPPPAAQGYLDDEQAQAQRHEDGCEQTAGCVAEPDRELLQDRCCECRVPHHLQHPELGEQVERYQQRATSDRRPQLWNHHPQHCTQAGRAE
jgi:hypothetical protein